MARSTHRLADLAVHALGYANGGRVLSDDGRLAMYPTGAGLLNTLQQTAPHLPVGRRCCRSARGARAPAARRAATS